MMKTCRAAKPPTLKLAKTQGKCTNIFPDFSFIVFVLPCVSFFEHFMLLIINIYLLDISIFSVLNTKDNFNPHTHTFDYF